MEMSLVGLLICAILGATSGLAEENEGNSE